MADFSHIVQRLIVTTHNMCLILQMCGMAIPNHPVVEVAFAVLVKAEWKTAICRGSEELSLVELLVHFNAEEEGIVQEEEQPKPEEKFWYHKNIKEVTILTKLTSGVRRSQT